jgi:hypothetical protein
MNENKIPETCFILQCQRAIIFSREAPNRDWGSGIAYREAPGIVQLCIIIRFGLPVPELQPKVRSCIWSCD